MAKIKREIDKDLMYKKLMPSNLKAAKIALQEPDTREPEPPSLQTAGETLQEPLNSQRTMAPREISLPLIDNQPTVLINLMEKIVLEELDPIISKFQCCKCDRCKKDIIALALNKLPPRYMVLAKGQVMPPVDHQTNVQVLSAIIRAVTQVRTHPRH